MKRVVVKAGFLVLLVGGLITSYQTSARADQWCTPWDQDPSICIDNGGCCTTPWDCDRQCMLGADSDCHCIVLH
jgi:hypothetical protein